MGGRTDQSIKNIIERKNQFRHHVKDYSKVVEIIKYYDIKHYDLMAKEIYFYKAAIFWTDIWYVLSNEGIGRGYAQICVELMYDLYSNREDQIWNEIQYKKERKKFGL